MYLNLYYELVLIFLFKYEVLYLVVSKLLNKKIFYNIFNLFQKMGYLFIQKTRLLL